MSLINRPKDDFGVNQNPEVEEVLLDKLTPPQQEKTNMSVINEFTEMEDFSADRNLEHPNYSLAELITLREIGRVKAIEERVKAITRIASPVRIEKIVDPIIERENSEYEDSDYEGKGFLRSILKGAVWAGTLYLLAKIFL